MRAIDNALPDYLGGLDGERVQQLLSGLADEAIARHAVSLTTDVAGHASPAGRAAPGRRQLGLRAPGWPPVRHRPAHAQRAGVARRRGDHTAARLTPELAAAYLNGLGETGIELGADQAAAVRGVLTSGATVESLVGPAGTGKSFVLGVLNHAWTDPALWPTASPARSSGSPPARSPPTSCTAKA